MIYPGFMVSDYISEKYGQMGKFLVGIDTGFISFIVTSSQN